MDKIEQEILDSKQKEVDFIESGVIRVVGLLIRELSAAVEDDRLTLEKIRAFSKKLSVSLNTYDKAMDELDGLRRYYKEKYAVDDAQKLEAEDDNHK